MSVYEVTNEQYEKFDRLHVHLRGKLGFSIDNEEAVVFVSWHEARAFCDWLSRKEGLPYRLPTEAEWEYACRAGTTTHFHTGDVLPEVYLKNPSNSWYPDPRRGRGREEVVPLYVGKTPPNPWGLYDTHGNVWEWCLDQYHFNYKGAPTNGSAWQDSAGTPRVLRGGGWDYHARNCRSAVRCGYSPGRGYTFHGLRLVWFPYARKSDQWFASWEAEAIGDNIVSYQSDVGAWPKNMHMEAHGYQGEKFTKNWGTSIDNGATYTQMNFLARLYRATKKKRFKDSFIRGLDWLLQAQYDNGGWPQRYPLAGDYGDHITFNDDAMVGVLKLMRQILEDPESDLVDPPRRRKVKQAYETGLQCILDCQVVIKGCPTVWGQQHDPKTLLPRPAREYEPVALCGRESTGIVLFLMSIENPSPSIIQAIEDAVAWFRSSKITGIRIAREDGIVVEDTKAPDLWARFYEIQSGRPIFGTYDGKVKYSLKEIVKERRTGYQWYSRAGDRVLLQYPKWKKTIKK